ncbi:long-chain-fatty-acid-CoA-ligase [Auricularia subglabra TFB-10046 SS5]|nr:long-chain-fatty-acid-CoA-ligase [Auricularia subglabra TFB-10046 SS5]
MLGPKPNFGGAASIEVSPKVPGESPIRRSSLAKDKLAATPQEGVETVYDVLKYTARTFGTKPAFGYRDVVSIVEEEKEVKKVVDGKETVQKKVWKYFQLSDYKYISFVEFHSIVTDVAKGLVDLGIKRDDVVNIFAATSHNWQIVQHASMAIGSTIATAYDTLGEAGLTHSLNEPEVAAVFTNAELLDIFSRVLPNTPTPRLVIYDGEAKPAVLEKIKSIREDLKLITLDELRTLGKNSQTTFEDRAPKADDIACIMYTSGTTGNPKGVLLKHSNLIGSIAGLRLLMGSYFKEDDTMLHYLPLAHVLEYIVELYFFYLGITCGYGRVKTLTDASVRKCKGDLAAFAPSLLIGVPAVFEMIRKGIVAQVNKSGPVRKSVFNAGLTIKKANVPGLSQVVDAVVMKAVKEKTGGRLRITMSGGAALSQETQEFLTAALVDVLQGYGMTESCGMCAILAPEFFQFSVVGAPVPCIEIKLVDVPDAGYLSTNKQPQGEILIRGPAVTSGYYKRPDLNNDPSIFEPAEKGGWLHTGDVGQWNPDGTLSIIDRIKNLVKLSGGEYIALERLEATYKSANVVSNLCVVANSEVRAPIAVVFPHELHLRAALGASAEGKDLHALCESKEARDLVLRELVKVGKGQAFKPMETITAVVLTPDEWTPESGLVTAAQKVQRKKVEERFSSEIKAAFKASQGD